MSHRDDLWIVVPNWQKFQHYRDRRPPWIKLYTELNSRDDWLNLSMTERGLLVSIWLEYAASNGVLSAVRVRSMVHPQVHRNVRRRALVSLSDAGFIQLSASKPLEIRARTRSTETETEKTLSSDVGQAKSAKPREAERASSYSPKANVLPKDPAAAIAAMIRNGVIADLVDLDAELAGYRLEPAAEEELRALFELTAVVTSLGGGA